MKIWIHLFAIIILASCSSGKGGFGGKGVDLKALSGTWQQRDKQKFEKWALVSPTESIGVAYDMTTGSTVIEENMRLFKADDSWVYEVKLVANQSAPVKFVLAPDKVAKLRFVNEKNDYPQVIKYFILSDSTMKAEISDLKGGNVTKFDFVKAARK
ncbi:MAG: hypothetical protein HOP11_06005 [Saprospiraceae bacterium]|nr:hypothetical protein [Saprospiraceae bacterium]